MNVYNHLCWYDPRNPNKVADPEWEPREKGCPCDNCMDGNDQLAMEIIRLRAALTKSAVAPNKNQNATRNTRERKDMQTEFVSIEYARYKDDQDQPTCARSFEIGAFCPFIGTRRFGLEECCLYPQDRTDPERQSVTTLFRRNSGDGSLEPRDGCPLWRDK